MSDDMDHTNKNTDTSQWVYQRLTGLPAAPGLQDPDLALNHYRSYERKAKRHLRMRRAAVVALTVASILILTVPATRSIARQLFDRFYMRRPEAVRSNDTAIGTASVFRMEYASPPAAARFVSDIAEARQEAGFDPRLPPVLIDQIASGLAVLKVSAPIDGQLRIHVDDLIAALRKRGIDDVRIPRNWEGNQIGYHLGMGVSVHFLGGVLGQSPPPSIITPPGFPIFDFTEIALRAAGLSRSEAHSARNLFVDSGGAFAIVPADAKSRFREISLKASHGLLFENDTDEDERRKCSYCAGPHERVLTWAAPDRVFQLRSQTMTLDQMIGLANSIN